MGIFTINDVDKFWNLPAPLLLPFYQKIKQKYYQRINEENIAVAKLNVTIQAIANSFGKNKFNSELVFKESLPFNPDLLNVTNNEVSPETADILRYYIKNKIIPDIIINTMKDDERLKDTLKSILIHK